MNETKQKSVSRNKSGFAAKVVFATVAIPAIGLTYMVQKRNELPNIAIPVSPQPNPNAYPYFVAAGKAIQDNTAIGNAISNKPNPVPVQPKTAATPEEHVYTLAEKENLLRENRETLKTLREGFAYPFSNPAARSEHTMFPEFATFRSMARLLILESQVQQAHGDWNGAVNSELDALELGVMVPRNGVVIANLVGIACEAIGRRPLWDDYLHLDSGQARAALQRLQTIEAKRFSYADTMEEEKRFGQAALLEDFRSPEGVPVNEAADTDEAEGTKETPMQKWAWKMRVKWTGSRAILSNYTTYQDQIIENARKPYGLHLPLPTVPNDPVNQQFMGVFYQARIKTVITETENRLLAVSLALHIYHEEHGAYPQSLDALKDILPANLRNDPFAIQGDLRYRLDGAKYILYSVGPDGKDDNGTPIYDETKSNERQRYFVESTSVGDVVAGVNK